MIKAMFGALFPYVLAVVMSVWPATTLVMMGVPLLALPSIVLFILVAELGFFVGRVVVDHKRHRSLAAVMALVMVTVVYVFVWIMTGNPLSAPAMFGMTLLGMGIFFLEWNKLRGLSH